MVAETLGGTLSLNTPIIEGEFSKDDFIVLKTNGADMFYGGPVSRVGESNLDCDLPLAADDGFAGVAIGPVYPPDSFNIDTLIPDNTWIYVLKPTGGRVKMVGKYLTGVADAVTNGKALQVLDGGKLGMVPATTVEAGLLIGRAVSEITGHATEDRLITYWY